MGRNTSRISISSFIHFTFNKICIFLIKPESSEHYLPCSSSARETVMCLKRNYKQKKAKLMLENIKCLKREWGNLIFSSSRSV